MLSTYCLVLLKKNSNFNNSNNIHKYSGNLESAGGCPGIDTAIQIQRSCYISKYIFFKVQDFIFTSKILFGLQEANWSLPGGSWRLILGIYKSNEVIYVSTYLDMSFLEQAFQFLHQKQHLATCRSRGWSWTVI